MHNFSFPLYTSQKDHRELSSPTGPPTTYDNIVMVFKLVSSFLGIFLPVIKTCILLITLFHSQFYPQLQRAPASVSPFINLCHFHHL